MEKLITKTSQITTTIISNATGKNTYAIERTLSNIKGDTARGIFPIKLGLCGNTAVSA